MKITEDQRKLLAPISLIVLLVFISIMSRPNNNSCGNQGCYIGPQSNLTLEQHIENQVKWTWKIHNKALKNNFNRK